MAGEIFILSAGGGGGSLNYEVVSGTSAPSSPSENTIWVNTSTAITSHVFSSTQPSSPAAGMVWFKIGTSSPVAMNVIEDDNQLYVYPMGCQQYISGAWASKEAKTYQSGAWEDWINYLYNGESSGWKIASSPDGWGLGTFSYNNAMVLTISNATHCLAVAPNEAVDLTGFNTLKVIVSSESTNLTYGSTWIGISTSNNFTWNPDSSGSALPSCIVSKKTFTAAGTITLDVTNLNGKYYPVIMGTRTKTIIVPQVILEE